MFEEMYKNELINEGMEKGVDKIIAEMIKAGLESVFIKFRQHICLLKGLRSSGRHIRKQQFKICFGNT